MRVHVVCLSLAFLVSVWVVPGADAQTDRTADAVAAFEEGTAAAGEERWSDAIPAFRRAYALSHSSLALFNAGYALRALGRFVDARAAFDEVIATSTDADLIGEARTYRDEVAARIAQLHLEGLAEPTRYDVRLDATHVEDDGTRPLRLELDPGAHSIQVHLAGFLPFDWSGELREGAVERLSISLAPVPSGSTVLDEPWFWVVIGVVVVGAAIAIGYIADDAAQLRPAGDRTVVRL